MKLSEFRHKLEKNSEFVEAEEALQLQFELANCVLRARLKKGWSQTDLAKAIGTKQANISRIEAGLANPTITLIQKLIKSLDLEIKITPSDHEVLAKNNSGGMNAYLVPDWPSSPCNVRYDITSKASNDEGKLE
jgi:ribosome-binding protein aMBF1 (putative translation factor)